MKRVNVKIIMLIMLAFVAGNQLRAQAMKQATEEQKNEIVSQITKSSKNTLSLQCRFTQKKKLSMLSETVLSEGVMYFKRENNLRWQYNKPYPYIFILSANKVFIKNDKRTDRFDTSSNKMFREISEIMIGGVNGSLLLNSKKFTARYMCNGSLVEIILTPKSKEIRSLFKEIVVTFAKSDWLVRSIEMREPGGDNTVITFVERNVNGTISDDLFRVN